MAKKVQLMTNAKEWQVVDGVEVLVDVPQEDIDPITDSGCVEIEGHRTLEETISQENMFTPEIVETKVHSKVGGVYHDNVVDGAYEEAILYGNTQVNLVESITSGTKYIPHSFTSFQGNESKIGNYNSGRTNQVAPLVKGVTMVNLAQETSVTILEGRNGGAIENVKSNTKYTLALDFTVQNTQKGFSIQSFKDDTYLETAMIKIGMGEKVKFTFTTHEEANRIYIVNNSGYGGEIQLDNIMVIEGDVTDLDLPFFKGMRSVELSRPLTNLFTDDLRMQQGSQVQATNTNGNVTVNSQAVASWISASFFFDDKIKPNTKYIVMWDSLTQTQTDTNSKSIIAIYQAEGNINLGTANLVSECPTLRSIVFDTTGRDYTNICLRIHATLNNSETGVTTVTGLRVFEWDDSLRTLDLQTIGYFSGTKYVSARALETEGKNLYPYGDVNFTPTSTGWFDAKGNGNMYGDIAQKSKCRFLLKKGTYKLSSDYYNRTNLGYMSLVTDKEEIIGDTTFTLDKDTYLTLRLQPVEANVPTTLTNIQIERGETATTYEAYQSRYYKPRETEEIILRSLPNGVFDTFNLQTGELVQNIGEIVLDGVTGVQDWQLDGTNEATGISGFYLGNSVTQYNFSIQKSSQYVISDKFKTISFEKWKDREVEGCVDNTGNIAFLISNSKLSEINNDGFKQYLQSNPVTVQYALKEPIITKLQTYDRIYNGQTNGLANMGNNLSALTYYASNYYLKVGNLSPIPAILEPITTIPYDVRLKPSTLYTVKYNRGGNSNSMSFDLGGSVVEKTNVITDLTGIAEELTVKTPAILSHEQLILSGTGYAHNFIIVEGDITGTELPYFEGMKDVKMPIVKNIGKNLFDINGAFELGYLGEGNGLVALSNRSTNFIRGNGGFSLTITTSYGGVVTPYIKVKPNTKYMTSAEYINVPASQNNFVFYDINKKIIADTTLREVVLNRTFTTPSSCEYIRIGFWLFNPSIICYENIQLEECLDSSLSTPYQQHKENSVYAVQGEYPITSEMIEQGGFSTGNPTSDGSYETMKYGEENGNYLKRLRSKNLIPVKPNTTYAFAHSFSRFGYNVYQWNGNREFMDGTSQYFASGQVETITTTADTQYIHFLMSKHNANETITVAEYDWSQFHMYELDSTINLRSLPNGVKDELNLLTGEYIQRVGEVVLDNTETWNMDTTENATQPNTNIFYTGVHSDFKPLATVDRAGSLVCDKVNVVPDLYFVDKVGIMSNTDPRIYVRVSKTDAPDVATFTTYIQNNPLTLQYELAEPIISHVRLVSNNQEREVGVKLPNGVCNTYNPSTGMTTVRVGKIVLDGSEDWDIYDQAPSNLDYFRLPVPTMFSTGNMNADKEIECKYVVSDTFPTVGYYAIRKANSTINYSVISGMCSSSLGVQCLYVYYKPSADLATFKTYLASNPITVWYELKYPQIQPDIVLPNGVHDEYNPETGVYTKKVGFIEFDGSEDWYAGLAGGELQQAVNGAIDMYGAWTTEPLPNIKPATNTDVRIPGICDGLKYKNAALDETNEEFYFISSTGRFNMNIAKTKLVGSNKTHLKAYLSQNPIKLWYELQIPITYQLTPYFGLPQPYAYEDGYLIHDSAYAETTLPPEFKYKLVANRTGQVMQNSRKLQEHTTRLSNLEAIIIEATIESLFNRELQLFELELMDIQLIDLGE